MGRIKEWGELTRPQQIAVLAVGGVELALTAVSVNDLVRRPAAAVRGRKAYWAAGLLVSPFGPIAYLLRGRR